MKKAFDTSNSSFFIILVSITACRLLGSSFLVLSLNSAGSATTKGTCEREVNVLL
ncbi:hypothetical protein HanIR_Chr17g0902901 [Helianthus annuus]|nr:hypothetical protein HanIR_Chr17g0902901 [Helianthus annuus]